MYSQNGDRRFLWKVGTNLPGCKTEDDCVYCQWLENLKSSTLFWYPKQAK